LVWSKLSNAAVFTACFSDLFWLNEQKKQATFLTPGESYS
jgi:hypothetical protein